MKKLLIIFAIFAMSFKSFGIDSPPGESEEQRKALIKRVEMNDKLLIPTPKTMADMLPPSTRSEIAAAKIVIVSLAVLFVSSLAIN